MRKNLLYLWDENIVIQQSGSFTLGKNTFPFYEVIASDDTQALVMIYSQRITTETTDVRRFIEDSLTARGLRGIFSKNNRRVFLESVSPLDKEVTQRFAGEKLGIIVLVNGREPGEGAYSLQEMTLQKGDTFALLYRIGT